MITLSKAVGLEIHSQGRREQKKRKKENVNSLELTLPVVTLTSIQGSTWSKVRPEAAMPTK